MDADDTSVTCQINIDWLNAQGVSVRKVNHRSATLRLTRSDTREIFAEVSTEKVPTPTRLVLRDIVVHKKFMSEGKASIKFNQARCVLFLSNAPPGLLMNFLKTLFVKMSSDRAELLDEKAMQKNIRAHMLSEHPSKFQDISPVTNAEMARAQRLAGISKSTTTTPSPPSKKRRFDRVSAGADAAQDVTGPQAKKALGPSPLSLEPTSKLNDEQNLVLKACLNGKNIFFTGSAGTGKSFLLKKIISVLPPDGTVATASTGVAACLIGESEFQHFSSLYLHTFLLKCILSLSPGGVTLHSFAGIGAGDFGMQRCYELAERSGINWRKCKRLIIDEISMVDGEYFEVWINIVHRSDYCLIWLLSSNKDRLAYHMFEHYRIISKFIAENRSCGPPHSPQ